MIQITADISALSNPRIEFALGKLENRINTLNDLRNYGSLPQSIYDYAHSLNIELTNNPSRSRYLDLHIRRNELAEPNMAKATFLEEGLESSSFKLFQSFFSDLDKLVQIRREMVPTKGPKPTGTSKEVLNAKRPEFDKAITELASSIAVFLGSLSNQSRDFIERYIKDHAKSVHLFMNAPLPKARIKFRDLLGLNKNQDGSNRERTKKTDRANDKQTQSGTPKILAEHYDGNTYKIKVPGLSSTFYADKVSRTYKDGSARFEPDPYTKRLLMQTRGQNYIVAFIEK